MEHVSLKMQSCGEYFPRPTNTKGIKMNLISREDLKEQLEKRTDIKLVFVQSEWHYRAMHIPGSINLSSGEAALKMLKPDDNIVVYCVNELCPISVSVYNFLVDHGFKNVRRYAGGLMDWEQAGYQLEGEMAVTQKM